MLKSKLLRDLNQEQRQAVTYSDGPLLVIAGAGTGKTKTIAHKAAWLIEQKIAKPSEILALTFTDKAAKEMEERIDLLVPLGTYDFTAATFHSFCQDILKEYGIVGGISPDFQLLTESQQILFLRQNLDQFNLNIYKPISSPQKFLASLIKLFSRAKDEIVSVNDYLNLSSKYHKLSQKDPDNLELAEKAAIIFEQANAYKIYECLKKTANYFDFGDLILKTLELLKSRKTVLESLQNRYKYIFVDEFQDTNYAQGELIYLLAKKFKNLTVVGDDDQSIYKFRGASVSNIMEFLANYPQAKKVVLTKNYRSTSQILDASYKLIKNNNPNRLEFKEKISKRLTSEKKGANVKFWHFQENSSEIEEIIKHIIEKIKLGKSKFSDFAILIRANSYADDFISILKNNNLPYQFVGSRGLYDREEIREIISYLKILYNPDDNLSLFHLANSDQFRIDKITLRRLTILAKQKNIPLVEIFTEIKKFLPKNDFSIKSIN
ncbi:MAG: ATP-dependent helicase, partial [Patescibacteria group bacterium]|nr:ATP-dependent helicase [Patescibacteria group bacterium]